MCMISGNRDEAWPMYHVWPISKCFVLGWSGGKLPVYCHWLNTGIVDRRCPIMFVLTQSYPYDTWFVCTFTCSSTSDQSRCPSLLKTARPSWHTWPRSFTDGRRARWTGMSFPFWGALYGQWSLLRPTVGDVTADPSTRPRWRRWRHPWKRTSRQPQRSLHRKTSVRPQQPLHWKTLHLKNLHGKMVKMAGTPWGVTSLGKKPRTPTTPTSTLGKQCHNCQGFGHTTRFCKYLPMCAQCSGAHRSTVSPLPP